MNNNIKALIVIVCMIPGVLLIGQALNGWLVYDSTAPYVEQPSQISNGTWIIALGAIVLILTAALALTLLYYKLKNKKLETTQQPKTASKSVVETVQTAKPVEVKEVKTAPASIHTKHPKKVVKKKLVKAKKPVKKSKSKKK